MPAPTNTSALTAIDLGTLPASVSQDVHDAGTTYTVWYKFTASADGVVGVFGFGSLGGYAPDTAVFVGPAASPVTHLNVGAGDNQPVQFPVASGVIYYLRFRTNAGNPTPAMLLVEAELFTEQAVSVGAILDPDDTDGFPAAILDPLTGEVQRFVLGFPAGESAFALDNGYLLTDDRGAGQLQLFGPDLTVVTAIDASIPPEGGAISGNKVDTFYVSNPTGVAGTHIPAFSVGTFGITGAPGPQTWMIGAGGSAIAVSPDETILYYTDAGLGKPIKRWDLVNDVALSDLTAAPDGSHAHLRQILCLRDGTVLVFWARSAINLLTV